MERTVEEADVPEAPAETSEDATALDDVVEEESLFEDISIDGMCGVY